MLKYSFTQGAKSKIYSGFAAWKHRLEIQPHQQVVVVWWEDSYELYVIESPEGFRELQKFYSECLENQGVEFTILDQAP